MTTLRVGLLIDGTGCDPIANATVVVQDALIYQVVTDARANPPPRGAEVVDLSSYVIAPGFIDLHVHLRNPHTMDVPREDRYRFRVETEPHLAVFYGARNAQLTLAAGFTTLRNMGGIEYVAVREAIDRGLVPGPRVLTSGLVVMTGGHTDRTLPRTLPREKAWPGWQAADGVDGVRRRVRELVSAGADFVKFDAGGGIHCPDRWLYSKAEAGAIVEEAQNMGVRVAAHAHGNQAILRAVEAGVNTIEHGTFLDSQCVDEMAAHGTTFVPTLAILHDSLTRGPELGYSKETLAKYARLRETRYEAVRAAHRGGVTIALGTDSSGWLAPHGMNGLEFELLVDAGLSPMESLLAGTNRAAAALGLADAIGTIEVGKQADFVVLRSDPLADMARLRDGSEIAMVWRNGEPVIDLREPRPVPEVRWLLGKGRSQVQ